MNGKTIMCAIKVGDKYMQDIKPNENYCRSGTAPTMGTRFSYSEFKSVLGDEIKPIEPLTITNYLKVLLEEYRWNERNVDEIEIIPLERQDVRK